jgi:hypothetical protein
MEVIGNGHFGSSTWVATEGVSGQRTGGLVAGPGPGSGNRLRRRGPAMENQDPDIPRRRAHLGTRTAALARVTLAVAALLGLLAIGVMPTAAAATSHRVLNDTRAVSSAPVVVDFPIQYFGVVGELATANSHLPDEGPAPFGQARFRVRGEWTPWQHLDQDGAQMPGHFTGALVSVDGADAYQVRGLPTAAHSWRAAAINTTDGPSIVVGERPANVARAASGCLSRADWGADESISGWAKGSVQGFSPVQALTVHHTAGSNNLAQDYSATMRAIYSYHVQTNGWSDIGYQYLVDGYGRVYEGRSSGHTSRSCVTGGGDGSDFAHQTSTDYLVTGSHVGNMNSGNLGVALMGCFEATSACSGSTTPTAGAVDGLEILLASLSSRHRLDPQGTVHYVNPVSGAVKDVRTISGHRDWLATACPGGVLYAQLPAIRSDVASRTAPVATAPGPPTALTATAAGATVSVTWSPPTSTGGSAITSYQVFRGASSSVSGSDTLVFSGQGTATSDIPAPGTYWYAVRACSAAGCGSVSTTGPVTVAQSAQPTITSAACKGAKCTFSGTGIGVLHWSFGNDMAATGSPVTVTYRSSGAYTVTLTDGQSSGAQATRSVTCAVVKRSLRCTTSS